MNPLTNMKNVKKLSEQELSFRNKTSWHDQYRRSAWVFIGGLPYDLTEGDIICIFSQYGEIVHINLIRDKDTGKSKGFGFVCYEDQRSTDLAVDNFNGIKILNRTVRVDHVSDYKMPKDSKKTDEETRKLRDEGCLSKPVELKRETVKREEELRETLADCIVNDIKLPPRLPIYVKTEVKSEKEDVPEEDSGGKKNKKSKKEKKEKKHKKKSKKRRKSSESDSSDSDRDTKQKYDKKHKKH